MKKTEMSKAKKTNKARFVVLAVVCALIIVDVIVLLNSSVIRYKGTPDMDYSAGVLTRYDWLGRPSCIVRDEAVFYTVDYGNSGNGGVIRRVLNGKNEVVFETTQFFDAVDRNTLVLRYNGNLVLYNIADESRITIGDYGLISAGNGKVYCYTEEKTDELHQYDTTVFDYNVEDGSISEILHFVGTQVSYDHRGLFYTDNFVHKYYSFEDNKIIEEFEDIEWTDLKNAKNDTNHSFARLGDKIMHTTDNILEVYDLASGEMTTVLRGKSRLIYASMTEDAVYYSNRAVDISLWTVKDEKNGTYKFSFETGETEKISNKKYHYVVAIEEDILVVEGALGRIKKVKVK